MPFPFVVGFYVVEMVGDYGDWREGILKCDRNGFELSPGRGLWISAEGGI